MTSPWKFDKLGGEVELVTCIVDYLTSTLSYVVFIPAIASHALMLLTSMTEIYMQIQISYLHRFVIQNFEWNIMNRSSCCLLS